MQALFKDFKNMFGEMNKYSKSFLKYGLPIAAALYISAVFCFMSAGVFGQYYTLLRLGYEFLECGKEFFGAIAVPALFLEILFLADKIDRN